MNFKDKAIDLAGDAYFALSITPRTAGLTALALAAGFALIRLALAS